MKNECKALGGKYNGFRVTYVECVTDERNPSRGVAAAAQGKAQCLSLKCRVP